MTPGSNISRSPRHKTHDSLHAATFHEHGRAGGALLLALSRGRLSATRRLGAVSPHWRRSGAGSRKQAADRADPGAAGRRQGKDGAHAQASGHGRPGSTLDRRWSGPAASWRPFYCASQTAGEARRRSRRAWGAGCIRVTAQKRSRQWSFGRRRADGGVRSGSGPQRACAKEGESQPWRRLPTQQQPGQGPGQWPGQRRG